MKKLNIILIILIILIISFLLFSCKNNPLNDINFITIGTFNIQWLGDGINDNTPRTKKDINNIANIIEDSDIDILALQEIENAASLEQITKLLPNYKYIVSTKYKNQNVGVIYKDDIEIKVEDEYQPLTLNGRSRPGLVLNIKAQDYEFYAMIIHLKATSKYDSTQILKEKSIEMRKMQAEMISHWADSMINIENKKELVIIGDFNDFPKRKNNATLTPILQNKNLIFLTDNERNCINPYYFTIDNIVVSKTTKKRFIKGSVFTYDINSAFNKTEIENISDHCPISIQLKIK